MRQTESNNKTTLIEQTYSKILCMIGDGSLKPSEFISHRLLADELNISKQPVGIALQRLENEGVIESVPRVGTRIRTVTAEDMWGMLQWRLALEIRIAGLAAKYAEKEELERLEILARDLDKAISSRKSSIMENRQIDMAFHLALADASHCWLLRKELSKLNIYYLKSMLCDAVQLSWSGKSHKPFVTHSELLKAVSEGDSRKAGVLMADHLEKSADMEKFVDMYKTNSKIAKRS